MLYEQKALYEQSKEFLSRFGLKRYWVAQACDIPKSVFYEFVTGKRVMTNEQVNRLASFIVEYTANNSRLVG